MSRILNDKDRNGLLAKYKEDKLRDAPQNITDKTLIENYGTDEQKALLEAPSKEKGADASTETNTPAPATNDAAANSGNTNDGQLVINTTSKEYVDALNDYIVLNDGQAPKEQLSLEQLVEANNARTVELSKANTPQEQPKPQEQPAAKGQPQESPNLQASTLNKDVEKVTLVNKAGQERRVSKFTFENYLKNDAVWKLKPGAPSEVENL